VQASPTDILNTAPSIQNGAASSGHVEGAHLFGVTLIGATAENGRKLLLTIAFIVIAMLIGWAVRSLLRLLIGSRTGTRVQFWARQAVSLFVAASGTRSTCR
jgi:hypothetical protein